MAKAAMAVAQEAQERHSNTQRLVGDEFRLGDRVVEVEACQYYAAN